MPNTNTSRNYALYLIAALLCLAILVAGGWAVRMYSQVWKPNADRQAAIANIPEARFKQFATLVVTAVMTRSPAGLDLANDAAVYFRKDSFARLQSEVAAMVPEYKAKNLHMTPTIGQINVLLSNNIHYVGVSGTCHMVGNFEGTPIDENPSFRILMSVLPEEGYTDPATCKLFVADYKIHLDTDEAMVPTPLPTSPDYQNVPDEVKKLGRQGVEIALTQSSSGITNLKTASLLFGTNALNRLQREFKTLFPAVQRLNIVPTFDDKNDFLYSNGINFCVYYGELTVTGRQNHQKYQETLPFKMLISIVKNQKTGGEPFVINDYKLTLGAKTKQGNP